MEELYRRADKYYTLEDNIRATSQTVMITVHSGKATTKSQPEHKGGQSKGQKCPQEQLKKKRDPPQFTPLNISYDRLLPHIRNHPEFKWPPPMRANPDQRNQSLRCDYHIDHIHETNHCQGLNFLVERLIRARHLKRFIQEPPYRTEYAPAADRAIVATRLTSKPRPTINFVLGGPIDDQYQSKKQRRKMLRAASVKARVNTINTSESTLVQPINGPIFFPPVNPTWVITPHYDAPILTLCINNFYVHKVLVDPGSTVELLHPSTFMWMKVPLSHLNSTDKVLSGFNGSTTLTVGDIDLSVKVGPVTQQVLFSVVKDLGPYNAIVGQT